VGVSLKRIYLPQLEHEQSEPQLPVKKKGVSMVFHHLLMLYSSSCIFPSEMKPVDEARDRMGGAVMREKEGSLTAGGT
jgi:hypothetical protein